MVFFSKLRSLGNLMTDDDGYTILGELKSLIQSETRSGRKKLLKIVKEEISVEEKKKMQIEILKGFLKKMVDYIRGKLSFMVNLPKKEEEEEEEEGEEGESGKKSNEYKFVEMDPIVKKIIKKKLDDSLGIGSALISRMDYMEKEIMKNREMINSLQSRVLSLEERLVEMDNRNKRLEDRLLEMDNRNKILDNRNNVLDKRNKVLEEKLLEMGATI